MTKSYGSNLTRVVNAIIFDCITLFPGDRQELLRDQARLSYLVERRGQSLFTIDLPALGKHFDLCLSRGTYASTTLPCSGKRWSKSPIPKLFSGLLLRVFNKNGMLRFDADVNAIAALRQIYFFAKKLKVDCSKGKHYDAVQSFCSIEAGLEGSSLNWDSPHEIKENAGTVSFSDSTLNDCSPDRDVILTRATQSLRAILELVCDRIATSLGEFEPREWRPKHGPGAVSDQKPGKNKYLFPTWTEKLDMVFPFSEFAFANLGLWADHVSKNDLVLDDIEPSSNLISVPKTQKGPRLIASEPVAHQWCQQVIWNYLEERVARTPLSHCITFRDQRGNQNLARIASESGSHWTVDLSSASDYLSLWCVERLFRRNPALLEALCASRTTTVRQDIDAKSPRYIKLKKFSTMGSACTFPVQSIFFAACAIASVLYSRNQAVTRANVKAACIETQIYGDDIIIPADSGEGLAILLGNLGFTLNADKTFMTGRFRESCGVDAYAGYDVTPAYVTDMADTRRPESVLSTLEQSNNFFLKGWWRTSKELEQTVGAGPWPVLHVSQDGVGWKSFVGSACTSRTRYNHDLQRTEYYTLKLTQKSSVIPTDDWSALLQYFTEAPPQDILWESGVKLRPRLKLRRGWEDLSRLALAS